MLGRLPSSLVGEIGYPRDKGLIENVECGCGVAFRSCPFWTMVGDAAFGGWDRVDPPEAVRLRGAVKLKGRSRRQGRPRLVQREAVDPLEGAPAAHPRWRRYSFAVAAAAAVVPRPVSMWSKMDRTCSGSFDEKYHSKVFLRPSANIVRGSQPSSSPANELSATRL
jgi:hypothetical protein